MPNFEILPSFFHFHFAVFGDDHGACGVKHVAAAEKWVGVCSVSSVCVHGVKGKKGACKTSNHPFNFLFMFVCVCVCVFMQEMVGVRTKDLVHAKEEGLIKGLCAHGQPFMHSTTFLL